MECGDGHFGIRFFVRHGNQAIGNEMHAANQSHVSGGRRALAEVLLKHEDVHMKLLSPFGLEAAKVQARATLHLSCADMKSCDSKFYVGGWHSIDFVAWAIELQQPIYLVAVGDLKIQIFEPD